MAFGPKEVPLEHLDYRTPEILKFLKEEVPNGEIEIPGPDGNSILAEMYCENGHIVEPSEQDHCEKCGASKPFHYAWELSTGIKDVLSGRRAVHNHYERRNSPGRN